MEKARKKRIAAKPKRSPEPDVNQLAHYLVKASTERAEDEDTAYRFESVGPTQADISLVMAELGRRGGKIGGVARAASMSPERRREIALKAARKRWDK